jgi:hypothetical protein
MIIEFLGDNAADVPADSPSFRKQPYQDGWQSERQQVRQGEFVSLDRLIRVALIPPASHGASE